MGDAMQAADPALLGAVSRMVRRRWGLARRAVLEWTARERLDGLSLTVRWQRHRAVVVTRGGVDDALVLLAAEPGRYLLPGMGRRAAWRVMPKTTGNGEADDGRE